MTRTPNDKQKADDLEDVNADLIAALDRLSNAMAPKDSAQAILDAAIKEDKGNIFSSKRFLNLNLPLPPLSFSFFSGSQGKGRCRKGRLGRVGEGFAGSGRCHP